MRDAPPVPIAMPTVDQQSSRVPAPGADVVPDAGGGAASGAVTDAVGDAVGNAVDGAPGDAPLRMTPAGRGRLLIIAFLGEGLMFVLGLVWILARDRPFTLGLSAASIAIGLLTAVGLAIVQYAMLWYAPAVRPVRSLRRLYRDVLFPLFRDATPIEIVVISLLAGIGEEVFFRGGMQQQWGLVVASVLFGVCHIGGRATLPLGLWAACTGALLGGLAMATGGLAAPIVAHAAYDALALSYLRWGPVPSTLMEAHLRP